MMNFAHFFRLRRTRHLTEENAIRYATVACHSERSEESFPWLEVFTPPRCKRDMVFLQFTLHVLFYYQLSAFSLDSYFLTLNLEL